MKRPEKRYDNPKQVGNNNRGYNLACSDWQQYHNDVLAKLGDEGEIEKILWNNTNHKTGVTDLGVYAKTISQRIKDAQI